MAFGDSSAELSNQQLNCVLCGSAANSGHLSGSRRIDINVRTSYFRHPHVKAQLYPRTYAGRKLPKGRLHSYALTLELLANTSGNCRRYK